MAWNKRHSNKGDKCRATATSCYTSRAIGEYAVSKSPTYSSARALMVDFDIGLSSAAADIRVSLLWGFGCYPGKRTLLLLCQARY